MTRDLYKDLHYAYHALSTPLSTACLLSSRRIHPAYGMTVARKQWLGARMMWSNVRIPSATIYKLHLAMALKLLEMPPDVPGDVVECGSWKGASAANLSLVCKIVGRKLRIYDSFQGLPPAKEGDRQGPPYEPGDYAGGLTEVRENIRRHGASRCASSCPDGSTRRCRTRRRP